MSYLLIAYILLSVRLSSISSLKALYRTPKTFPGIVDILQLSNSSDRYCDPVIEEDLALLVFIIFPSLPSK